MVKNIGENMKKIQSKSVTKQTNDKIMVFGMEFQEQRKKEYENLSKAFESGQQIAKQRRFPQNINCKLFKRPPSRK